MVDGPSPRCDLFIDILNQLNPGQGSGVKVTQGGGFLTSLTPDRCSLPRWQGPSVLHQDTVGVV